MTCTACSSHVESAVKKLSGVENCAVNLMLGSMVVDYDAGQISAQNIIEAVSAAGYGAQRGDDAALGKARRQRQAQEKAMAARLLWSVLCLIPLFYLGMGQMLGLPLPPFFTSHPLYLALGQLAFCLPILILNRTYFTVGFSRLVHLHPNMDSLVALGASAGLIFSFISLIPLLSSPNAESAGMPELYFESAGMILSLVTVGKFLEQRAKGKTTGAMESLLALAPDSAVVRRQGREETVPLSGVSVGDTVIVRAGGKIGVDGMVTAGQADVEESAVTGESMPVEKAPGASVISGSIVAAGYLELQATRVGKDTTLQQILRLMEETAGSKAPIARLADRISAVFVPVVISLAVLATAGWLIIGQKPLSFALPVGIAVLVISCPCALGLATPVAITVGTGKAARHGILIKSAAALEQIDRLDTFVLDKTGTVTCGKPRVSGCFPAPGLSPEELLRLAASVETYSEHPLGQAVVQAAREQGISLSPATDFVTVPGGGVSACYHGRRIYAGNAQFLSGQAIDVPPLPEITSLSREGKTPLFFGEKGRFLGMIAVADTLKEDSAAAVAALQAAGRRVILLTGDNEPTARAIAAQAGIPEVLAQVLPQDKAAQIARLQHQGHRVAMVGDGINDAPALQQAHVGFAIGAGTDVAVESAQVVLMKSSLQDLVTAVELSRAVLRNIKGNLFWAFFYNIIGIPIAAGALFPAFGITLNPMIAAACMSLSSVCVCTNALRLRRWQPRSGEKGNEKNSAKAALTKENKENFIETQEEDPMIKTITIEGMMCTHCSGRVEKALNALPGVTATVDLEAKTATVTGEVSDEALRKAVTDAGYEVVEIR